MGKKINPEDESILDADPVVFKYLQNTVEYLEMLYMPQGSPKTINALQERVRIHEQLLRKSVLELQAALSFGKED